MKPHGMQTLRGADVPVSPYHDPRVFGRLFANLEPFDPSEKALEKLGGPDGPMDESKAPAGYVKENMGIPAGFIFLGQFIDHDITLDTTSNIDRINDTSALRNFRSPGLDLDCIYGSGPEASPHLYDHDTGNDKADGRKLLIGTADNPDNDLARNRQGRALIGDPRNDENILVSQLQLAFIKFHNVVVDQVIAAGEVATEEIFKEASRIVRWHYQWIIRHEFLPLILGKTRAEALRNEPLRFYPTGRPTFIPLEFGAAAYRFGHSQLREKFDITSNIRGKKLFELNPGFSPVPKQWKVEWWRFFDIPDLEDPQPSHRIDAFLPDALLRLPDEIVGKGADKFKRSLAFRNMLRGRALMLPSGQAVAKRIGAAKVYDNAELDLEGIGLHEAPLWYYVLKEAELDCQGAHLGEVGGTIVGETLEGLLRTDPKSQLNLHPNWKPDLGETPGDFKMADLLTLADSYAPKPIEDVKA